MNGQPDRPEPDPEGAEQPEAVQDPDSEGTAEQDAAADPVAELQAKADENWNRYLRAAAEVENIRKRAARDVEHARKFALESFSKELLGVKDSLEMGLAAAEGADVDTLMEGKTATLKLLTGTLERFGIQEVDPEGEPFDPERHEAMSMQPNTRSRKK